MDEQYFKKLINICSQPGNAILKYFEVPSYTSENGQGRKRKKKKERTVAGRDQEKEKHLFTVGGSTNSCSQYGNQRENFSQSWKQIATGSSYITCTYTRQSLCLLQRGLLIYAYCSSIHKGQEMETAYISISRGIYNKNMVNLYNGILFSYQET